MGTILFLVLRLAFGYNALGDAQAISMIVSLDTIAVVLFLKLKKAK